MNRNKNDKTKKTCFYCITENKKGASILMEFAIQ